MDVFSATDVQYLPQSVIKVRSKNGLNFRSESGSTPILEFELSGSLGYIANQDTVLNFEFGYINNSGPVQNLRPQASTGIAAAIRQIDCTTFAGQHLEQILDYDVLQGVLSSHDNGHDEQIQDGTFNKRALTECYCRDDQNPTPFVNPSVSPSQTLNGDDISAEDSGVHSYQTQKITLPIKLSAILGKGGKSGQSVLPLAAIGGVKVRFLMHECAHFTVLHKNDILEDTKLAHWFFATSDAYASNVKMIKIAKGFNDILDDGTGSLGVETLLPEGLYTPDELETAFDAALTSVSVTGAFNATGTTFTVTNGGGSGFDSGTDANFFVNFCKGISSMPIAAAGTATLDVCTQAAGDTTNGMGHVDFTKIPLRNKTPYNCNPYDLNSQPFLNQQKVQGETQGLSPNVFVDFGSEISSIKSEALTSVFNMFATEQSTTTDVTAFDLLNDVIFLNLTSAFNPTTAIPAGGYISGGNTIKSVVNTDVDYFMNNVSLDVVTIQPPPAYINSLMTAVNSPDGLDYSINTWEIMRTNVLQGEGIVQMNLPYSNTQGRSILSVPTAPSSPSFDTFTNCNLLKELHMTKYFYTYNGVRHPSLGVDCNRLLKGLDNTPYRPSLSQELIAAQQGAYEYSLDKVRSLTGYLDGYKTKVFFVGRNLGVLNSVMNVQDSNLSLTIEATSGTPISKTMTMDHFLYVQNTINITSSGVVLLR